MLPVGWLRRFEGGVVRERPLAPLTTWLIGGPAQLYLEPASVEELAGTVRQLRRIGLPFRLLGGGSNLLVSDRGVRGAVISLARLNRVYPEGEWLVAEGGARLPWLVRYAATQGLSGAEKLAGIPGRVGGAVFGNAGGKYGEIGALVRRLDLLDPDGELAEIVPGPAFFQYRGSQVGDRIVVRARLALEPGRPSAVRRRSLEVMRERRRSQPGWIGNAGCVFRNPEGASAGRLIDEAGCKRFRVGSIRVSARHANFFENEGAGSADDVLRLVERVRARVLEVHGAELELEVRRWA